MHWWQSQAFGAVVGAVVTGSFLLFKQLIDSLNASKQRMERLAEARVERARAATSVLADNLSALTSAFDVVVQSAREYDGRGGASEFAPTKTDIPAEVRSELQRAWTRYQTDTGQQLPGRSRVEHAARQIDLMVEYGTVPVFDHGQYQGDTVAELGHAHQLLRDLQQEVDLVLAMAQTHVQTLEENLEKK